MHSEPPAHEPPIEERFALGERLGRGASGEVLRAQDRLTGRTVAVKRLHARSLEGASLERFRREARLLARVVHPHVVRYIASGVDATGAPCLVVEWLDGEDLARRRRRERVTYAQAIEIARQAALGLGALHQAGIVHRDVKPSNLFLVRDDGGAPLVKLIDLGVARGPTEETLTVEGSVVGTPFYMAPEQARGEVHVGPAADLFALGVVLFELVAGRRPILGDEVFAVLAKLVLQDAPRLIHVWQDAPADLDALLARALARAPAKRFPSALAMAEALVALSPFQGGPAPDESTDDAPTARLSLALSPTREQRVVSVVFGGLAPWVAPDGGAAAFTALAEEHGATCHPTADRHVLALFGGERSAGDEAVRAARAALAIAARVGGVRLAIVTGRALSDASGVGGDVLERGAALLPHEDLRDPSGTLRLAAPIHVDAATALLLAEHFVVDDDGRHRVLRSARASAAGPRQLVGRPTPCVGRERELSSLEAMYRECVGEPMARAVVITGAPGVGKSRVRYELVRLLEASQPAPTILFARGSALAAGSAFGLLAPALRRLVGMVDGDAPAAQRARMQARLQRLFPAADAAHLSGPLAELAGVADTVDSALRPDAALAAELLRGAFLAWLDAECAAAPVVLVLEDAHWGDLPTLRFVDAALRELSSRPLFVVVLARPEVHETFPRLFAEREVQHLRLGPLGPKASERLVRAALGDDIDRESLARVLARAEGNAFFLEELVRAVADGAREDLPDTVLGVLQVRLDALGPGPKRVLRAASVVGQVFWRGAVEVLLGGEESAAAVGRALDALCHGEVISRRASPAGSTEEEYAFRHGLVREAAYATLTDADRSVGHRLAGAWLERTGRADAAALALHFERGEAPDRAAGFHLRVAEKALRGNDFGGAVTHAERAAQCGEDAWLRGEARLIAAEAHRWRGELADAAACAENATGLLLRGDAAWFHAVREAIAAYGRLGQLDGVRRWADQAVSCEPSPRAIGACVAALVPAAVHLGYAGEVEASEALSGHIERLLQRAAQVEPVVLARVNQMRALSAQRRGDLAAAVTHHEVALASFERAGDRRGACLTQSNLGCALVELGAYAKARDALERALDGATRMSLTTIAPLARQNLGLVLALAGQLREARALEVEALSAFASLGDPRLEHASRVYLALIDERRGDHAAAETQARHVVADQGAALPQRALALAILSRALLGAGRLTEAVAAAQDAEALVRQLGGLEELEALVPLSLAEALLATGKRAAAKRVVDAALSRLHERAALLGDPDARARFLTAVPHHARCADLARQLRTEPG